MALDASPVGGWRSHWTGGAVLALADHGLSAAVNLGVNIALARWLKPEEYAAFAVAYSLFLLLSNLHHATLAEPMMVLAMGEDAGSRPSYMKAVFRGSWSGAAAIATLLVLSALVFRTLGQQDIALSLVGLTIASPFILFWSLVRRGFYVTFQLHWALIGSSCYLILVSFGILLLHNANLLSSITTLINMGVSGLAVGMGLAVVLGRKLGFEEAGQTSKSVLRRHLAYSGWNVLGETASWASGQILVVFVPVFLGLGATATLAAVSNLFRPLNLVMQSAASIALPALSAVVRAKKSKTRILVEAKRASAVFAGGTILYCLPILVFGSYILHYLYDGKYDASLPLIWLFCGNYVAAALLQTFTVMLKAAGSVRAVVLIWATSAGIVTATSIPAMTLAGLNGGLFAVMCAYLIAAGVAWRSVLAEIRHG